MVAEQGWSPERGSREQIADVHASQVVEQIIEVPKMAEQILNVSVLETEEQSGKLPNNVPQDRIRQRTVELIADILVPQDVEELARFFKVSFLDRVQQSSAEQTIETPDITLGEKIVDGPVTQTRQGVNACVQHVVNAVEVEKYKIIEETVQRMKPIIQEKINHVTKQVEVPLSQFNDKVVDVPVVAKKQISMVLIVQKSIEISQLQVDDKVVDVPVVVVAQVPQVHVEMKTVEIPQLQVKAVDVPVVLVMPVSQVQVVKKTVENSQFEIVEKIVENPVIDACLTCDAKCMVACESCVKDNMFMVPGEITVAGKMYIQRETLQQSKIFRVIKKTLVEKCLEMTKGSFVQGGAGTALSANGSKRQQHQKHNNEQQTTRQVMQEQWGEREGEEREKVRKGETGKKEKGRAVQEGVEA